MKYALGIEYNGTDFFGWQAQQNLPTIQGSVETALSTIADEPIQIFCAGRTDAGVHATGQVIHFESNVSRQLRAWIIGANTHLPSSIAIKWAQVVDDDFHARFSAEARRYRYLIYNHSARPAILASKVTWYYYPLNIDTMREASSVLIGEKDFSSFRSSQCESTTPMRHVQEITLKRQDNFVIIEIQANAFLHHMVRNIVGTLLQIGSGWKKPEWMQEVLHAKDRRAAAETASPHGLYLSHVLYPPKYEIPHSMCFPTELLL